MTEALAAAGEAPEPAEAAEAADARGESLLLPLLQGLLGGGGERLLAGLGAAGADVVADVRRSLGRLRAALAPPAQHPQARALLALAERLEDALRAADRLDGVARRPRRRSRAARHTVGVTREELAAARRLVDRDELAMDDGPPAGGSSGSGTASTAPSDGPPTPERRRSVEDDPAERKAEPPVPVVERRAPGPRKPDFFRHSIADAPAPQTEGLPRVDRRPSERSGIAAIASKFDSQTPKDPAPAPLRRVPAALPPPTVQRPVIPHEEGSTRPTREDPRRVPLYRPLPPTYNFAAPPPAEEPAKPPSRFGGSRRSRMKRANTIDIGRQMAGYRVDSDTDEEAPRRPALVPEFRPQTDSDRKFVAFMQRNQNGADDGGANWSNRFGNIKNTFENRERDERSHSASASSAKRFWRGTEEPAAPRGPRRVLAELNRGGDIVKPPWAAERREPARAPPLKLQLPPPALPPQPPPAHPPVPHSPVSRPQVMKPFIAKPIPVNQFSHAPMSAFKPPKKIMSPTGAPAPVWSPPSSRTATSPAPVSPSPPWAGEVERVRRTAAGLASRFEPERPAARAAFPATSPRNDSNPLTPPSYGSIPTPQTQGYPVRHIPSQNDLAAPELVKKLETVGPIEPLRKTHEPSTRAYETSKKIYAPPKQIYEPPKQTCAPPKQFYAPPKKTYERPKQIYDSPIQTYEPPRPQNGVLPDQFEAIRAYVPQPVAEPPQIDAQKLQIEFYEKQIREKARREAAAAEKTAQAPLAYTVTDYTPALLGGTFVPLQQTPDIEKARAHKIDYLPDVVLNESHEPAAAPRATHALHNGHAAANGAEEATEHGSVETRVMRGPVCGAATITTGVRTRNGEAGAATSLRGVLDKFSAPKRGQVRAPPPPASHAPPPRTEPARAPLPLGASRESVGSSESPASCASSPLARSGSWHRLAAPEPASREPSPRRVVARAKSMHLLNVPKLYEGGARDDLGEKRRTVEAYFSGRSGRAHAAGARARASRSQPSPGSFALGRSRTMPTVSELQFLDESNADDAFEDLVSGLA